MFFRSRTKRGLRRVTQSHTHQSVLSSERQLYVFKELFTKHYGYVGYGIVFFLIVLITSYPYISHANISVFYPSSCLGGWEHPEHATGEPTLSEKSGAHEFTSENAAVIHDASASIYCGSFGGDVPQETTPKNFVLHLSLAVDNGDVVHDEVVQPLETTTTENGDAITAPTLDEAVVPPVENSGDETGTTPTDTSGNTTDNANTDTNSEAPAETQPSQESAPAEQSAPAESAPVSDGPVSFLKHLLPSIFEKVFAEDGTTDAAPVDATPAETPGIESAPAPENQTTENSTDAVVTPDSASEPQTEITAPTLDDASDVVTIITPEEQSESAIIQVNYTLDGTTWKELGTITREHWQNPTFELPLTTWDDLSKFQVELKTLPTLDSNPHIYLDGMSIEVENEKVADAPTILLKDPSVILSGSQTYNGNETPSFDVLTPDLSTIDILGLVQSDRAEVLEDKSGVLGTKNPAIDTLVPDTSSEATTPESDKKNIFEKAVDAVQSIFSSSSEDTTTPQEPASDQTVQQTPDSSQQPTPDSTDEKPVSFFHTTIPKKKFELINLQAIGHLLAPIAHAQDAPTQTIETTVLDVYDRPTDITARVVSVFDKGKQKQQIKIDKPTEHYRPGLYKLKIIVHTAQATVVSEQDFTWGVLSINTDRSIYLPGDNAYLQMGVLTDEGHTVCDADLELDITSPNGSSTHFSTSDESIVRESKCQIDNVTEVPDYYAHFPIPSATGTYTMHLTATTKNGQHSITDQFEVQSSVPLDVVRSGPTRINPIAPYPVTLHITSDTEWNGTVTEVVPKEFTISKPQHSIAYDHTTVVGNTKVITWNAHIVPGKETTLGYVFDAPDQSPEFYLLGPAQFISGGTTTFTEARRWQIASDGSCQTASGTSGNWSTAGTWTGTCTGTGGKPGTGDTVTINSGYTVTMDEASAVLGSLAINGALNTSNGTSWGLSATDITIGAAGTLTANASTITLSGTTGTLFTLTGGGTFTAGTSTVVMNPNASITTTSGAITFNNLTFSPAMATNNKTYTMGSGALTINGNWNIAPTTNAFVLFVNMGADVTVASTGTLTVGGTTATSNLKVRPVSTDYNLTAGSINITAQGTIDCTSSSSTITLTGTSGTLFTKTGTFTFGTTEVIVTSASGNPTLLGTGATFHRLTINAAATVINAGAGIIMSNASSANRLYIKAGVLNDGGNSIAGTSNGTFVMDAGAAFCVGGTPASTNATCDSGATPTVVSTFPTNYTNGNITFATTSTVYYNANGTQTISSAPTYGNLTLRPLLSAARTFTFASGLTTVAGNFDSTPTSNSVTARVLTVNLNTGGLTVTGSSTIEGRNTTGVGTTTLDTTASNFQFTTASVNIVQVSAVNSVLTPRGSTITLNGTSGTLLQRTGTFTTPTSTGVLVFNPNASVTLTDSSTYNVSTVQLTPVLTADRTYTFGSGAFTFASGGNFTINPSASTSSTTARLTVTMGVAITVNAAKTTTITATQTGGSVITSTLDTKSGSNFALSTGFLSIGAAGTLTAQGSTITLTGTTASANLITFTSGATFNGGTSTVSITGVTNSNIINSTAMTGSNKMNNLTLNCTGVTKSLGAALEVGGTTTITLGTLDTDATNNYALTTGKISIANSASAILKGEASTITLTGTTSTLFTRGASGVFTQGTSNVVVAPASGTGITLMSGTATFHILTINSSATVINAGAAITFDTVSGNKLYVQAGVFNDGGNQITATTGTIQVDASATFCIDGVAAGTSAVCNAAATPTTATTFPGFTTVTLDAASTVIYAGNATTTVSAQTYGNLKLIPALATSSKTYTFGAGTTTINGNFDIIPVSGSFKLTVNMAGTINVASTKTTTISHLSANTAAGAELNTNTSNSFSTGFLVLGGSSTCGATAKCTFTAGSSTVTLTGTSGTLITYNTQGVFTQGTSNVTVTSASGPVALLSGAQTFHILTINSASSSTVVNAGAAITIADASGSKLYVQSGVLNDSGSGIATSGSTTNTLQIDSGGTLCLGGGSGANTSVTCDSTATSTTTRVMPSFQTYTLDAASTVIYNANANTTISSKTYGNLKLMPKMTTGVGNLTYTMPNATVTINGNFDLKPSASNASLRLTVNLAVASNTVAGTTTLQPDSTNSPTTKLVTTASNYALTTGKIDIESGGTLDASSSTSVITLNGTSGTLFTNNSGTFTAGSSSVKFTSDAAVTLFSGTFTGSSAPYDIEFAPALGADRTYTGGAAVSPTHNFTIDPTGGSSRTLTYNLGGTHTITNSFIIQPGATTNATVNTTSGGNYAISVAQLDIEARGTLTGNNSTITLSGTTGTPFTNNGTFTPGTSTVVYTGNNGAGNTTIASGNYYSLTTNNSSETYVLAGTTTLDPAGTLTITDGTVSTTGSNYGLSFGFLNIANSATAILNANASTITVTGTSGTLLTRGNNGVFTAGSSTVNLSGNGSATINSGNFSSASNSSLYNLTSSGSGTKTFGANINVDNVLNITAGTFAVSSFTLRLGGTTGTPFTNSGTFDPGTGTVTYNGNNAGGNTTVAAVPYYNLTLSASETFVLAGTTTADPAGTVSVSTGTLDTTGTNYGLSAGFISISSGATLTANASTITLTGTSGTLFTKNATGTFTSGTSTLVFSPDAAVTLTNNTPITVYNLSLTPNISVDRTYTFGTSALTVNGDFTINPTATTTSKTLTASMGNSITVDTAKTTTLQGSGGNSPTGKLDTGGNALSTGALNIAANGLLKANASTITVAGNWTNAGTFTKDTSLVTLNSATTALVTGATAFYDLTITHSAAKEVDFQTSGSPVFDVTHTFTVTGHSSNRIKLYSDSGGTKWQFHPTGTASVDYADVHDGGCQPGAITMAPTNSIGSNVDACWGLSALTFTFSNDDATIGFGALDPNNARFATNDTLGSGTDSAAANVFTVSTSAGSGYTLTYYGDTLKSGSNSIAAASITNDADGTPGTAAFGLSVSTDGSSTIASGYDHNATAGLRDWTFVPNTISTIASYNAAVLSPETISAYYLANIAPTTPAGSYSTSITYVVTGNF